MTPVRLEPAALRSLVKHSTTEPLRSLPGEIKVDLGLYRHHINNSGYHMGLAPRKPVFGVCEQHRRRPTCASVQSDQRLCYPLIGKYYLLTCYKQNFNFLVNLCGLKLVFSETPKTGFLAQRPNLYTLEEPQS